MCVEAGADPSIGVDKKQLQEMTKNMSKEQLGKMCEGRQKKQLQQAIQKAIGNRHTARVNKIDLTIFSILYSIYIQNITFIIAKV